MPNLEALHTQTSTDNLPKETFKLGNLTVDPQTRRIANKDQSLTCEPSVFNLLLYFCVQDGEIISRDQMITDVWKGRVVSDNAINRKIYQLRKELAMLDSENEYIETVTKYGYRLAHTMTSVNSQALMQRQQQPTPKRPQLQWLLMVVGAILLLVMVWQLSKEPEQQPTPKLKQLTSLQGIESDASLSPDGKSLLFSFSENGQGRQLILQDTVNGERQTLSPPPNSGQGHSYDIRGQWHPSGEKIAFIRMNQRANTDNNEALCVIYLMTITPKLGKATKLRDCAAANLPSLTWGE
ncbi:MAG: winged helix-turn-helix domain-containing protein, partial [Psychrosphaera sp.]|nr:winged helix-turn-helix domain-containing protein [Psychrosphaera sp.]